MYEFTLKGLDGTIKHQLYIDSKECIRKTIKMWCRANDGLATVTNVKTNKTKTYVMLHGIVI